MVNLPNIRNITVSGRIGAGTTTLAHGLSTALGWDILEGGALFEKIHKKLSLSDQASNARPDKFDIEYEDMIKKMLTEKSHQIIQSHLAGFDAKDIPHIFKILVICEDKQGIDKTEIRIDRLVNRKGVSVEQAKVEVRVREKNDLAKWQRLYANNDQNWTHLDKKYYDLVINTYDHNQEESVAIALKAIGFHA